MTEFQHNPPQSTRSLHSTDRINIKEFLNAERRVDLLDPSPKEFNATLKASVSITAYRAGPGERSPFPSPVDFIDDLFGVSPRDQACDVDREDSYRSCSLLKLAYKLQSHLDPFGGEVVDAECPLCGDRTLEATIGILPSLGEEGLEPSPEPRMVDLTIHCDCKRFRVQHYDPIERSALYRYVNI